ncbi:hypothetical protein [Rhodospirillaceae bacterium SYSU D60014]|uniref:hypothetical protein n=1 Tax=Virgifigura deserti TaxID=2268457 RepID=UPI000E6761FE
MHLLLNFTEALASVPDPINLAGYALAAAFILNVWWAYAAGVSWGVGLWLAGVLLDGRHDWTAGALSAQMLGSLMGNLIAMWVVLTIVGAVRAIRLWWMGRRVRRD